MKYIAIAFVALTLLINGLEYTYIGCYREGEPRVMCCGPYQYGYSIDSCSVACTNYKYFALQDNGWCSCSNDYDAATKNGEYPSSCPDTQLGAPGYNDLFASQDWMNHVDCWFDGASFDEQNTQWNDKTNNANHAVITNPNGIALNSGADINNELYVSGSTSTSLYFSDLIVSATHTVINLCKYYGYNKKRIIQASSINALFGFWESGSGVAYEAGWMTLMNYVHGWVLSIQTKNMYRANGVDYTVTQSPNTADLGSLGINYPLWRNEASDFACAEVLILNNYEVNAADIQDIEEYFYNKYKIGLNEEWRHHISAWFDGSSYSTIESKWYDKMGKNNANTAYFSDATGAAFNVGNDINDQYYISGTTQTSLTFGDLNVASNHTVINLCKYNGYSKRRIIQSKTKNVLFGFWNGLSGVAHEEGWISQYEYSVFGDEWVFSIQTKNMYRANGIDLTTGASSNTADVGILGINGVWTPETSDFACAELIILNNYEVTNQDIAEIEDYFDKKYDTHWNSPKRVSAWFDGVSFNSLNNAWNDKSIYNNDAVITNSTGINNDNPLSVSGTPSTSLYFGANLYIPPIHTIINLCRYNGNNKGRIVQSSVINALYGFWNGASGVAYENGWMTQYTESQFGDEWVLSIQTKNTYRANGIDLMTATSPNTADLGRLGINGGLAPETSDFECAEVILMSNYQVNNKDIIEIEEYFENKYSNTNINIPFKTAMELYPTITPTEQCDVYVSDSKRTKTNQYIANVDIASQIIIEFYFQIHSKCDYICCNLLHIGIDDNHRVPSIYICGEYMNFHWSQNDEWDAFVSIPVADITSPFFAPSTLHYIYIEFNTKKKLIKIDDKIVYLDENINNNFQNTNYHQSHPLYISSPRWPTFDATIHRLCVKTTTLSLNNIQSQIGSIKSNDLSAISGSLNPQNLYCGNPQTDKPLWAALLSINTQIYELLQNAQNHESVVKIHEYIQCSEVVYFVVKSTYSPVHSIGPLIEKLNQFLDVLDSADIFNLVQSLRTQTIDEINVAIANLLDEISSLFPYSDIPYPYDSWSTYLSQTTPAGDLFNPINRMDEIAKVLSFTVCDEVFGSIDGILDAWYQSDAIQDLIAAFDEAIPALLNTLPALNDGNYKAFSLAATAGMNVCFAKGVKGCMTRAYGISFNLNNEHKTFESRSVGVDIPAMSIGAMSQAFFHFDFMSDYKDITASNIVLDIGIVASVPGLSQIDDLLDAWAKISSLPKMPFVGDSTQIGVDFVDGKLSDFEFLLTILSGGLNTRLSIVEGVNEEQIIDCKAFRINLNAAREANGVGLYFGIDYRKNVGEIELNDDWVTNIHEFGIASLNTLIALFWNIAEDMVVDIGAIGQQYGLEMVSLVSNIFDIIVIKLEEIPHAFLSKLHYLLNLWQQVLNGIISAKGSIVTAKQSCNGAIDLVQNTISGAKLCWDDCDATNWAGFCIGWIEVCIELSDFINVSWMWGQMDVVCNVLDGPISTLQTIENNAYTAQSAQMEEDIDAPDPMPEKFNSDELDKKLSRKNTNWYRRAFYLGIAQSVVVCWVIGLIFIYIWFAIVNKYKSVQMLESDAD